MQAIQAIGTLETRKNGRYINFFYSNGEIDDRDYLIVVPRLLRGGATVNIGINIFGNISCDVELKLYDSAENVVARAKGHFQPNEAGGLELKVSFVSRVTK